MVENFKTPFSNLFIDAKFKSVCGKIVDFKFPNILQTKTDYCHNHSIEFVNELQCLPSGKEFWGGCEKCRTELDKLNKHEEVSKYLKSLGMVKNSQGEWHNPNAKDNNYVAADNEGMTAYRNRRG